MMEEEQQLFHPDEETVVWPDKVDISQLCRICANSSEYLIPIFDGEGMENELELKIKKHLPIKISKEDPLPMSLCYQCASTLIAWHDLTLGCIEADKRLRDLADFKEERSSQSKMYEGDGLESIRGVSDIEIEFEEEVTTTPSTSAQVEFLDESDTPEKGNKRCVLKPLVKEESEQKQNQVTEDETEGNTSVIESTSDERCASSISPFKAYHQSKIAFKTHSPRRAQLTVKTEEISNRPFTCTHCDKLFQTSEDMSNHLVADHEDIVLRCDHCGARFSADKDLEAHMRLHVESDCVLKKREGTMPSDEFLCNICGKSFCKRSDVFKHKKIFHSIHNIKADANGKFPCDICGKSFARKFHVLFHRERQHSLLDDCDENRDSNLDSDSEKSKYSCDVCNKDYSRKYDLKKHKMKVHSLIDNKLSENGQNIDQFVEIETITLKSENSVSCEQLRTNICLICRESFDNSKELKDHQEKHMSDVDDNMSCSMSDYSVNSDDISRHLDLPVTSPPQITAENKSFARQHKCTLCNHAYTRKHDMMKHRRQAHSIEERKRDPLEPALIKKEKDLGKKYNCSQCSNSYSRNSDLRKHVYRSHEGEMYKGRQVDTIDDMDIEILNRAKIEISGNVVYHCDTCGKNIITKRGFVRHVRIHTGERPFTCHVCGKQYRSSTDLMRHLRCVHDGIKNYQCDVCGRCFANKGTRNDHRRIHTGERPYICHTCGKAFPTPNSIYVHRRIHTDYFPHQCTSCDKRFRRRQQLIHHIRTHTGEKPHSCDICGKCFGVKDEVSRHRLTHSGEKPHVCSICGLCFGQKRYLRSHMKTHHGRLL